MFTIHVDVNKRRNVSKYSPLFFSRVRRPFVEGIKVYKKAADSKGLSGLLSLCQALEDTLTD